MAKIKKSIYFCQNCGHEESKWLGQCPMCKEWNTFVEEKVSTPAAGVSRGSSVAKKKSQIVTLSSVSTTDEERTKTGIKELDRVLGGNRTRFPRVSRWGSRNRKINTAASGVPEAGSQAEEGALYFRRGIIEAD